MRRRRELRATALHSFSLAARFIRLSFTGRRRDLLMNSRRCASARLPVLKCASRPRAEALTLRALLVTLRRSLFGPTMRGIWLLLGSSRWLAALLLLLRRHSLGRGRRDCSPCSGWFVRSTGPWRSLAGLASPSAAFLQRG